MKAIFVIVILSFISFRALAEIPADKPIVSSDCVFSLQTIRTLPEIQVPVEFEAYVDQARAKAHELTQGIISNADVIESNVVGPWKGASGETIWGINVRVADDEDGGQANAYEYVFRILKNWQDKVTFSILTMEDDWHVGGDYNTVFICEEMK